VGRTDFRIQPIYEKLFPKEGDIALLGSTSNNFSRGDLYDLSLDNWDINSDWSLPKKYDAIISTRCPYFAKDPEDFVKRCCDNLKEGGQIFLDWGLGDHWRFENYKIGWVKEDEHESFYKKNNFLWSTVWDDSFLDNEEFILFSKRVEKHGYKDVKKAVFEEVPSVLHYSAINKYFNTCYNLKTFWEENPQLYIMINGVKK
jgi:SAM-dependent methyltransferase